MDIKEAHRLLHPDTTVKALNRIECFGEFYGAVARLKAVDEACLVACEALEKQMPYPVQHKVNEEELIVGNVVFSAGAKSYWCKCGKPVTGSDHHCRWCGQKLDWKAGKNDRI